MDKITFVTICLNCISSNFLTYLLTYLHENYVGRQIVLMPGISGHPITQNPSDQSQEFREQFERFRCREHFQSAQMTPMTEICSNLIFSWSAAMYDGAKGQYQLSS